MKLITQYGLKFYSGMGCKKALGLKLNGTFFIMVVSCGDLGIIDFKDK